VADWSGPVFFRLTRNEAPVLFDERYTPEIGKAMTLRAGTDLTLIGTGLMVSRCLDAAEALSQAGIDARVMEVHTIKPLDTDQITEAARETGALVTVEEHSIVGGLGGAVTEAVTERYPVPVRRVGIADQFAETGPYDDLLDNYGMSLEDITTAAKQALEMKNR
jgi:transketolase